MDSCSGSEGSKLVLCECQLFPESLQLASHRSQKAGKQARLIIPAHTHHSHQGLSTLPSHTTLPISLCTAEASLSGHQSKLSTRLVSFSDLRSWGRTAVYTLPQCFPPLVCRQSLACSWHPAPYPGEQLRSPESTLTLSPGMGKVTIEKQLLRHKPETHLETASLEQPHFLRFTGDSR